jgi:hypothetical protein
MKPETGSQPEKIWPQKSAEGTKPTKSERRKPALNFYPKKRSSTTEGHR